MYFDVQFVAQIQVMQQSLLQKSQEEYDAFKNPPNFELANLHAKAMGVGLPKNHQPQKICSCCQNIINLSPLPICFKDEDVLFLGVGYSLYYKLARYFMLIVLVIFFVSGSALYFLSAIKCQGNCIKLFGIPIFNSSLAQQQSLQKAELFNMLTCLCIFLIVIYLKTQITEGIRFLSSKKVCPSSYTVMLQNIPNLETEQFKKWLKNLFGQQPIVINWVYVTQQFNNAYQQKQRVTIEINQHRIRLQKEQNNRSNNFLQIQKDIKQNLSKLQTKVIQLDEVLTKYGQTNIQFCKIGTAFVTFQHTETVTRILETYECSFFNSFMKNIFSLIKKSRLYINGQIITVNKAPAPSEVIWENLRFSYIRSFIFQIIFIICMGIFLFTSFKLIFFFMNYAHTFKMEGLQTGKFILIFEGILMSLVILVINILTRLVIMFFTSAKRYYSHTKLQGSFCLYYSIFYIINSCLLVYGVHTEQNQSSQTVLLTDIHIIMITNAFSQPIFKLIDPYMWWKVFWRWNVKRYSPKENPYTQQYINKLWEGSEISNGDNYQYITRVLFVSTWFAHVAPTGVFLSLIALVLDYWIGKYFLVRVYRRPQNISQDIAKPTIMSLELLPLVYICGLLQYSFKLSTFPTIGQFIYYFFNYGITTIVVFLCICTYLLFCKKAASPSINRTYSQAKIGFGDNYESSNPITRVQGNINYLYDLLKNNKGNQQEKAIIMDLLALSRTSIDKFKAKTADLSKLKRTMLNRVSSIQSDTELRRIKSNMNYSNIEIPNV